MAQIISSYRPTTEFLKISQLALKLPPPPKRERGGGGEGYYNQTYVGHHPKLLT